MARTRTRTTRAATGAEAAPPEAGPGQPAPDQAGRRIEMLPLAEIVGNPGNPKNHDLKIIDGSVARFGMIDPIVLDGRTGQLISGHGRTETLRTMEIRGDFPPDGVTLDGQGNWLVPVAVGWASRTDTEASAALITLNRSTELGGWVDESLLDLLTELSEQGDEQLAALAGFSETEVLALARKVESEGVFDGIEGEGAAGLLDEFRGIARISPDNNVIYTPGYAAKAFVEIRDAAALDWFRSRLLLDEEDENEESGVVVVKWSRYPELLRALPEGDEAEPPARGATEDAALADDDGELG